mgnify:CR=1 FL=1
MMKNNFISALLSATTALFFVSCGASDGETSTSSESVDVTAMETVDCPMGFNPDTLMVSEGAVLFYVAELVRNGSFGSLCSDSGY